jgi:ribonuclease Z
MMDSASGQTQIIFLGTGTPNPDPAHAGSSIAIVVNNQAYLVDFGPGLVRQAAALSPRYGGNIDALSVKNLTIAFLTHLHSDHTTGYPDLIFTPWVMGRDKPLEVYGPAGIQDMTKHILKAYREDIRIRLDGLEPATENGWKVNTHEIKDGIIYKDQNIEVEAFLVEHGNWENAYGFIFTTPDRKIAISGDTKPCQKLIDKCQGVDVLIHEVYSQEQLQYRTKFWQNYHPQFHTSTVELAEIANQIKPDLLLLYHQLAWGTTDEELVKEITKTYTGKVISAKDLDIF